MLTDPFQLYNGNDFFYDTSTYRRMAHEAEMRRRAEMYYRMKAEEEARRRRQSEIALYQRMKEEEELRNATVVGSGTWNRSARGIGGRNTKPKYAIARGRDGRLYRVKVDEGEGQQIGRFAHPASSQSRVLHEPREMVHRIPVDSIVGRDNNHEPVLSLSGNSDQEEEKIKVQSNPRFGFTEERGERFLSGPVDGASKTEPLFILRRGRDGNVYKVPIEPEPRKRDVPTQQLQKKVGSFDERPTSSTTVRIEKETERLPKATKKQPRRKVTVVVEDASDDESEEDYESIWRNRVPSPGQWIEPVEGV